MKKQKTIYSVATLLLVIACLIPAQVVKAAQQTITVPTQAASDDPQLIENGVVLGAISELGVNLQAPLNDTMTPLDDASLLTPAPNGYTWRLVVPEEVCDGAQLTNLRIVTETVTVDEEPVSGIILGLYGSSDLALIDSYSINNGDGEDGSTWVESLFGVALPIIDRGAAGTFLSVPTFPADLGMAGTLDATWNISDQEIGEPLGIYVEHWLAGDTTTAQTTIESVQLTYDDEGCAAQGQGANSSDDGQESGATLAATGANMEMLSFFSLALLVVGIILSLRRYSIAK